MAVESTDIGNITTLVKPFADLIDSPNGPYPTQKNLDDLQEYYGVLSHTDFPVDEMRSVHKMRSLPFSFALGLHPAGPDVINTFTVLETSRAYRGTNYDRNEYSRKNETLKSIIANTVLHAMMDQDTSATKTHISAVINMIRDHGLLKRGDAKALLRTADLTML